jgi:hypothetical protein
MSATPLTPEPHDANLTRVQPPSQTSILQDFGAMAQSNIPRFPNVKFRILIVGRANAGKTTIIQRVADAMESPEIYRRDKSGKCELVRSPS